MLVHIIFEDESLVVIDKPSGIVVNKSDTAKDKTIQDWAQEKFNIQYNLNSEFASRGGIVHRLDKETSGILIIAKNPEVFENLKNQFKSREVQKTYIALVHGKLEPKMGEINVPVGRLPWNRTRFGVIPEGRDAKTLYEVLEYRTSVNDKNQEELSLVELTPKTGRTHQIRVHLKHLGHPIFSDELYAGRKTSRNDRKLLSRHFLHASKLILNHPKTNNKMVFKSELTSDLEQFLNSTIKR